MRNENETKDRLDGIWTYTKRDDPGLGGLDRTRLRLDWGFVRLDEGLAGDF